MFGIEAASQYKLENPPLAQALAQVRFPILARLRSLDGIAPLQDALSSLFPYMERVTEATLVIGPAGPVDVQQEQAVSWYFTDDEGRALVVSANSVTLSVGEQYDGVDDFSNRLEAALSALRDVLGLRRCDRLGVRFLDIVPASLDTGEGWTTWFRGELLGWVGSGVLDKGATLQTSITQTQVTAEPAGELADVPSEVQAVIRHGVLQPGSTIPGIPPVSIDERSFMLDLDLFLVQQQAFDAQAVLAQFRALHGQIDRFFRWSLTEQGATHFGLKEL